MYKYTRVFYKYLVPLQVALPELNDYTISLQVIKLLALRASYNIWTITPPIRQKHQFHYNEQL